jgi:hypothetical protein
MRSLLTKGICLALALSAAGTAQAGKKESQHRKRLHKLMIVTLTRSFVWSPHSPSILVISPSHKGRNHFSVTL